jgi:hypothetical protein
MKWVVLIGFVALAIAAGFGWKQVGTLQQENGRLRGEVAAAQANLDSATTSRASQNEAELQKLRADSQELLKLRGEVAQLRSRTNELAKIQSRPQPVQPTTSQPTNQIPTPTGPVADHFPRQAWTFAGYESPEAALVSAIWAMREGKPQVYLDSLSPAEQQRMAQVWQDKSEQEIAGKHQSDVANISDLRIMSRQSTTPNQVTMQVNLGGANRTETVIMENVNGQWKFGGFTQPQPQ